MDEITVHEGLETVRVFEAGEPVDAAEIGWREARGELRKDADGEWGARVSFWDPYGHGLFGEVTMGFGVTEDSEMPAVIERTHGLMRAALTFLRAAALAGSGADTGGDGDDE